MNPAVSAHGLVKAFGTGRASREVLRGVDFEVAAGEMVVILGRSGSGKSTLLNLISGLDRPDAGTIEVAGARLERLDDRGLTNFRKRGVGLVFQFFHLIPELSGEDNVLAPARLRGAEPAGVERGRDLIERLGLAEVRNSLPHTLSGGEQQRFAIARSLVNDPAVLLADEPTGNLDAASGETVLGILRGLADSGRAVVVVTHEREVAAAADRVVELEDGQIKR